MAEASDHLQALLSHPRYAGFEAEITRSPYDPKLWCMYLDELVEERPGTRWFVAERAVASLPSSYKLWHMYLLARAQVDRGSEPGGAAHLAMNDVFERCLAHLARMPRIWILYLEWLIAQAAVTAVRTAFDRALQSLPITQHALVWPVITRWLETGVAPNVTAVHLYRRYTQLQPASGEAFVKHLLQAAAWDEAASTLSSLLSDPDFVSAHGRTRRELWLQLCNILAAHPGDIRGVDIEQAIRSAIAQFPADSGTLWCVLADSWVRQGSWERARDVYEEGIAQVRTMRDFATIFEAYRSFEEEVIKAAALAMQDDEAEPAQPDAARAGAGLPLEPAEYQALDVDENDINLRLDRLEALMDRRPLLMSSVQLRQNPHLVAAWVERAQLYEKAGRHADAVRTFDIAVADVHPMRAVGGTMANLWQAFAQLQAEAGEVDAARAVYKRAIASSGWRRGTELAAVICSAAEFELAQGEADTARAILASGVAPASKHGGDAITVRQDGASRNARDWAAIDAALWGMFCDVEEALGTLDNVKAAYDAALSAHVATVGMVLNYTSYLQEKGYHEAAFQAFERAVHEFAWPAVLKLWQAYSTAFLQRYGGSQLERAREIFESAVHGVPAECAKPLYLAYAAMEEQHGRGTAGLAILRRAAAVVPPPQRLEVWILAAKRAAALSGPAAARAVYEAAMKSVPNSVVKELATHFISLERSLGETDRARALYSYAAQFTDPRLDTAWWDSWKEFETEQGNPETFKDMLRVKRSVNLKVSTQSYTAAQVQELAAGSEGAAAGQKRGREAVAFLPATGQPAAPAAAAAATRSNPDEVDLDQPAASAADAAGAAAAESAVTEPAAAPARASTSKRTRY